MKLKKILACAAALSICLSGFTQIDNGVMISNIVSAESSEMKGLSDEQITGIWEGFYVGTLSGGEEIKRTISLNIYSCISGAFKGIAEFTSSEGQKYFFTGEYDSESGEMNFQGTDWILNYSNYGFANFIGTLDSADYIFTGLINNTTGRNFELKKISDDYSDPSVNYENICREWVGEYDGISATDGTTIVRRNYRLSIDDISDNGDISGSAYISPSEKADLQYAETGSYKFTGKINSETGNIILQGDEWIEHPVSSNFVFVKLIGEVDGNIINGYVDNSDRSTVENGIWYMEGSEITKGDVNFDNAITVADLLIVKKYILMQIDFSKAMINLSDVTGDGSVNISDYNRILYSIINGVKL